MERVAFLIEATNQRLGCLLNPETLVLRRMAGVQPRRSTTGRATGAGMTDDPLLYTGGGRTQLDLELLFDISLAGSSIVATDVRELTAPLWNLAENASRSGRYGRPPLVRFIWGKSWNIPGIVVAVAERLEHFTPEGVPQQSWMSMRMLRVNEPPDSAPVAISAAAAPLASVALPAPRIEPSASTIAVHRPVGGAPATPAAPPTIAGSIVTGADMIAAAVAGTPAGQALLQSQKDIAAAVDAMLAQVAGWISAIGDSEALRGIQDMLSGMAQSVASVAQAATTELVEAAVAASAAVSGAAEDLRTRIADAAAEVGQEIAARLEPLLENVIPVARAMGEAAQLVAQAVKARAARAIAGAVTHIEWAVEQVDAALERVSVVASAIGAQAVTAVQSAAATLRAALAEASAAGKTAFANAIPAALMQIGEAIDDLWSVGEAAAARAIATGVRAMSYALQRIAAATEAIRSVSREHIVPTAQRAVQSLRALLRRAPPEPDVPEGADRPQLQISASPVATMRQVETVLDSLRSVVQPEELAPADQALGVIRAGIEQAAGTESAPTPQILAALDAIDATVQAVAAADGARIEEDIQEAVVHARTQPGEPARSGTLPVRLEAPPHQETRSGERLDQIAYRYYHNAALWRLVAAANDIDHPFHLAPDRPLRIPSASKIGAP